MASGIAGKQLVCARSKAVGRRDFRFSRPEGSRSNRQSPRLALVALLDEVVDEFAGGVIHLHVEILDTTGEVVEGHDGGDGDQ